MARLPPKDGFPTRLKVARRSLRRRDSGGAETETFLGPKSELAGPPKEKEKTARGSHGAHRTVGAPGPQGSLTAGQGPQSGLQMTVTGEAVSVWRESSRNPPGGPPAGLWRGSHPPRASNGRPAAMLSTDRWREQQPEAADP